MEACGLKEIQVQMTEAEREFRKLYLESRKKYNMRMHLTASVYENRDDSIEIWRMEDGKRMETVSRVKRKDIEECYGIAVLDLKFYDERKSREKNRDRF